LQRWLRFKRLEEKRARACLCVFAPLYFLPARGEKRGGRFLFFISVACPFNIQRVLLVGSFIKGDVLPQLSKPISAPLSPRLGSSLDVTNPFPFRSINVVPKVSGAVNKLPPQLLLPISTRAFRRKDAIFRLLKEKQTHARTLAHIFACIIRAGDCQTSN